ncbi:hypothetical protein OG985_40145 [Streptomyces sp. NBC_00289]|uniref:hypothetical protein n=1 Tax=Streptomyces sp. NBC_00289 TaxID=2975703 RepID=UPI00324A2D01
MTHDPDQDHTAAGEPPDRPTHTPPDAQADGGWELLTGHGGPEPSGPPGAGLRDAWRRRSVRARAVAAAATVAVLAVGGVAYAASSGGGGGGATPAAAGSGTSSASDRPGDRHGRGMWFGLGGDGVHGEATVKDRDSGEWVVRVWQWGTAEKVDGDQVTVRSEDGASWTWTVDSDTSVFRDGAPASGSDAVRKGETYYLAGTRAEDGALTAARVLSGTREPGGPDGPHRGDHGPRDWRSPRPTTSPSGGPGSDATT